MCPSYMVTREEKHSTRGRARLLWEMLNGDELPLWDSPDVLEALDLCLSCKGCTNECPVNVDMPTLKAEFLSHHYARPAPAALRIRLRAHRPLGEARRAGTGARERLHADAGSRRAREGSVRRVAGATVAAVRRDDLPALGDAAPPAVRRDGPSARARLAGHVHEPLRARERRRRSRGTRGRRVRGNRAAGPPLLRATALRLRLPRPRPATTSSGRSTRCATRSAPGTPLVGVEPSCVAVFRDELPKHAPARRGREAARIADVPPRRVPRRTGRLRAARASNATSSSRATATHAATSGVEPERDLLRRMGAHVEAPDSGCCGMAGAWGYEAAHYEVSQACGERGILPAVRKAPADAVVVADGFSCRHQIEQGDTGRRAVHFAQVLRLAAEDGPGGPPGDRPERAVQPPTPPGLRTLWPAAAVLLMLFFVVGSWLRRRRA